MLSYGKLVSQSPDNLTPASEGDSLNLDRHALGQLLDRHTGASRLVSEVLLIDRVHLGEVVHSGNEHVDLRSKRKSVSNWNPKASLTIEILSALR